MSRANKLHPLVSCCTWSSSSPKGAVLCTTSCGEDLCHHRQVATSIASVWIQIDFSAQKLLEIQDKRQKAQWKLDLMEQQAESYARLSSCSSLKPGGKKLSSKIGFVHKGGALRSLASLSSDAKPEPPLILCNYEISGGEEAKANWSKLAGRYHAIWNLLCKAVEKPLLSKIFSSVRCIRIPSQWPIY